MSNFNKYKKGLNDNTSKSKEITSLFDNYDKNLQLFKEIFKEDDTVIFREISPSENEAIRICLVYVAGMVKEDEINKNIIGAILRNSQTLTNDRNPIQKLSRLILSISNIIEHSDIDKMVGSILYGNTLLLAENCTSALILDSKGYETRSITESLSENVVRGPRDSFTESLTINTSLIRRRINNPGLKFNFSTIGTKARTRICVCYMQGMVNEAILSELYRRLERIKIDAILESGMIEDLISDHPLSLFKTIGHTERPDKIVANLLGGRIAIITDGTPIVLTVPFLFIEYFQISEDYYNQFLVGSVNRLLRWIAFFMSTSIPALYIALTAYQQEMIPTPLLLNLNAAKVDVPFPTVVELFIMMFIFEILREGGSRLPASIGSTISFVGAVVIGDAAVNAKFVSAPVVIIVAVTGLANFLLPNLMGSLNIVRVLFLFVAGMMGIYGYLFCVVALFIHLNSMYSFGIPYTLNISSLSAYEAKDTFLRIPWWLYHYRGKKKLS